MGYRIRVVPEVEVWLGELRPGAPATPGIRIRFAVKPPDTAILLAAGTERDWLRTWYAVLTSSPT
jgi:hypothetical protein